MIFRQFRSNGCLSYLIASEQECAVVDPSGEPEVFLKAIADLKLLYAIDTHSHADHVSLAGKLADETGAKVLMSSNFELQRKISQGKGYDIGIGDILKSNAAIEVDIPVQDGMKLDVGGISVEAISTPGHTKDAMCLLLRDRVLTGDTLMIGLAGRTDLPGGDIEQLYDTLFNRIVKFSDDLLIYPAHDYRGNINSSTGYERRNNDFLQPRSKQDFLKFVPKIYPPAGPNMQCGIRASDAPSKDVCAAIDSYFKTAPKDWNLIEVKEFSQKLDSRDKPFLLDVREPSEYASGHIRGAVNIPVRDISRNLDKLPENRDQPIVTYCQSGVRSGQAAMYLRVYGYTNVKSLDHGVREWIEKGEDVEK